MNSDNNRTNIAINADTNAANERMNSDNNSTSIAINDATIAANSALSGAINGSNDVPLTSNQVKSWADKLNADLAQQFGPEYKAIESTGNNSYEVVPKAAEYTAMRILESTELTDEQKEYLLFDVFGVSQDTINNMLNDRHYK